MDAEAPGLSAEMLAEATAEGVDVAEAYRVTAVVPYAEKPAEVNTYTMPPQDLDEFFLDYAETAEIVVDVRPVNTETGGDP